MKIINAGVTAPKGFKCAGLRAGVKPGKTNKDMAMIVSEVPAKIAGTFTKNIVLRRYHKMEQKITFMDIELDSENQVVTKARSMCTAIVMVLL